MAVRRILVPLDFSKTSNKALETALGLAEAPGAEIVLLNVVSPVMIGAELYGSPAIVKLLAEQEAYCRRKLEKIAEGVRRRHRAVRAIVRTGAAYEVIVRIADRLGVDLVVMGTQGRSGLSHLLIGSVAEKVVRLAKCPVLTIGSRVRIAARGKRRARGVARRPKR